MPAGTSAPPLPPLLAVSRGLPQAAPRANLLVKGLNMHRGAQRPSPRTKASQNKETSYPCTQHRPRGTNSTITGREWSFAQTQDDRFAV